MKRHNFRFRKQGVLQTVGSETKGALETSKIERGIES